MAAREPRIVAELGRPETTEETAARKAQTSREHRERRNIRNLIGSLVVSLAVVALIVLLVPRSNEPIERNVDVVAIAEDAQRQVEAPLAVPTLPVSWRPNDAELRSSGSDGVQAWYAGYLTPSDEFLGMYQGIDANPTWVSDLLASTLPTGIVTINGVEWTVYDNRETDAEVGNARYGLVTEAGPSTFVLLGTTDPAEFDTFAQALTTTIDEQP